MSEQNNIKITNKSETLSSGLSKAVKLNKILEQFVKKICLNNFMKEKKFQ